MFVEKQTIKRLSRKRCCDTTPKRCQEGSCLIILLRWLLKNIPSSSKTESWWDPRAWSVPNKNDTPNVDACAVNLLPKRLGIFISLHLVCWRKRSFLPILRGKTLKTLKINAPKLHFWKWIYGARVDVGRIIFIWYASGPGIPSTLGFGRKRSIFLTMRSKIVRRLPSWQRSGVVSQQRLRLRRFDSLIKRSSKLRSEPVSFLFLVCFFK